MTGRCCLLLLLAAASLGRAHNVCKMMQVPCAVKVMPDCGLMAPLELYQLPELTTMEPPPRTTVPPGLTTRVSREPRPTGHCVRDAYLLQDHKLYSANLRTGALDLIKDLNPGAPGWPAVAEGSDVNALGFNPLDNFIYGARDRTLLRFLDNGTAEAVVELGFKPNMGTFDSDGSYWFSQAGEQWGRLDLKPGSATYGQTVASGRSNLKNLPPPADWTFVPRLRNYLFGVGVHKEERNNNAVLIAWSMETQEWMWWHAPKALEQYKSVAFGSVVSTRDSVIYAVENKRGGIFRFPLLDIQRSSRVGTLQAASRADGARCVNAPDWDAPP